MVAFEETQTLSVLDVEEDRVIWVRESDLGQAVREAPESLHYTCEPGS